jgi:hypothetical protein
VIASDRAIVLDVSVEELIEDEDKVWTAFHSSAKGPPKTQSWRTE